MGKNLVSCFFLRHSVYIYIYAGISVPARTLTWLDMASYLFIFINKPAFSYLRMLTTWHCRRSPLQRQSTDISCTLSQQQRICCCGPMLGKTEWADRRTLYRFKDPASLTMRAVTINYKNNIVSISALG